jgi:hypothetical protein
MAYTEKLTFPYIRLLQIQVIQVLVTVKIIVEINLN